MGDKASGLIDGHPIGALRKQPKGHGLLPQKPSSHWAYGLDLAAFLSVDPLILDVLIGELELTADDFNRVAMNDVVSVHRRKRLLIHGKLLGDFDFKARLFTNLPNNGLLRRLTRIELTAGQGPEIWIDSIRWWALKSQRLALSVLDHRDGGRNRARRNWGEKHRAPGGRSDLESHLLVKISDLALVAGLDLEVLHAHTFS